MQDSKQTQGSQYAASPVGNQPERLASTIVPHNSYVLLHTRVPPTEFPAKVPSRIQRALQLHASQWGGVINFSWSPEQTVHQDTRDAEWESERETYSLTAFSRFHGRLEMPEISFHNLAEVQERLRVFGSQNSSTNEHAGAGALSQGNPEHDNQIQLYICTHRNRDCRCGESGTSVFAALRAEVARRQLSHRIKVGAVGHVGGHKYAANMLVFPFGDWLGNLRDQNVPEVLDAVLAHDGHKNYLEAPPLLSRFWRGRMGLSKDQQLTLLDAESHKATIRPVERQG